MFDDGAEGRPARNIRAARGRSTRTRGKGTLPAVSWITPAQAVSEHPPALVTARPDVRDRADQRDHAQPRLELDGDLPRLGRLGRLLRPRQAAEVDGQGYGLRVPGIVISPYAKQGYIDHQVLSFDAYLKFIEDDFLGGARLDPKTDGRPDPRPDVRENAKILGNLAQDFDFNQKPRPPDRPAAPPAVQLSPAPLLALLLALGPTAGGAAVSRAARLIAKRRLGQCSGVTQSASGLVWLRLREVGFRVALRRSRIGRDGVGLALGVRQRRLRERGRGSHRA